MAELQPPVALQNVATLNADDFRNMIKALVPTEGIVGIGDLAVTENGTPNMSVNVAAGAAFIAGDNAPSTQGSYFVKNDATKNLVVAAANPTNPRKDIVIAEVRDGFYSGSDNDWQLRIVTGTPAASPVEPALPNNAIKLATIDVPANDTAITNSQITDRRTVASPLAANPPACRVYHTINQTSPSGAVTAVAFNSERYDTDNMHDTSTNNSRITFNEAGVYVVTGHLETAGNGSYSDLLLGVRLNGSTVIAYQRDLDPGTSSAVRRFSIATMYKFGVGDYIELIWQQTNGSGFVLFIDAIPNFSPEFGASWIGRG